MKRHGICLVWILTIICAALATSCSKGASPEATQQAAPPAQPSATPAAQPTPRATAASAQPVPPAVPAGGIASGQFSGDPDLRCDLLEVRRVSGGALLVKWRIVNTSPAQSSGGLAASQPKVIGYDFASWQDLYYIDPAENKKYAFLTDAEGGRILDVFVGGLPAGQQRGNWAKFPAPPPTSNKVSVNIPKFPPFEDVSIAQ